MGKIESVKNSITGLFKKGDDSNSPSDHLSITISQVNPSTKERTTVCQGIL